jgi:hypothetical protein
MEERRTARVSKVEMRRRGEKRGAGEERLRETAERSDKKEPRGAADQ